MIFYRVIFALFLSLIAISGFAQHKPSLPAEAKSFVLKGYQMLDYIAGDINGDKSPDAILVLKKQGEDTAVDHMSTGPLLILLRQPDGKLKQEKRNDSMILCYQCGGAFGDPYQGITIHNNGFSIDFYGGSSSRWSYEYGFAYNASAKNWLLVKERQENYQDGDPEKTMQETNVGADEITGINFDNFNANPPYDDTRWKVTADKTFFFDNPAMGSKPRKAYLLKGNEVTGIRELKHFVEVSFQNNKDQFSTGYVLKKDLLKTK